jgi:hypothetical protein
MGRTETPAQWRKRSVTEIPVPVVAAPAPYSATAKCHRTSSQGSAGQTKSLLREAWKLDAKAGMAKLEKLAEWLEREHPDAADSLREAWKYFGPTGMRTEECHDPRRRGARAAPGRAIGNCSDDHPVVARHCLTKGVWFVKRLVPACISSAAAGR